MNDDPLYRSIFKRRSVREYDNTALDEITMSEVHSFVGSLRPLFPGIRTKVDVLQGVKVKGMFKIVAPYYLAFYSEEKDGSLINAGFMLQQMDLFFNSKGIGSCWLGVTKPSIMTEGELKFVILMAFGKPKGTADRSPSEIKRKSLSEITDIKNSNELLEAVRLAPSAMNKQSWFFTKEDGRIDVHYERSGMFDRYNQINSGIALCHLQVAAEHQGVDPQPVKLEGVSSPKGYTYAASLKMN